MRCFYHQDKEAVGICKSCGKGVCADCAVDLGKGLACRTRCEDSARALILLIDRNIELFNSPTRAQWVVPPAIPRTGQQTDFIAAQLSGHIRETLSFRRGFAVFCSVVGLLVIAAGVSDQSIVVIIVGACFVLFGVLSFSQARRSATEPRLPETQTR